ncbi:hypothetical protein [Aquimarina sp. 2304DJ70-9]|uniref:hypothetical protein n=1 Tax=Aquimarina penaris TaxID=3231044 RepID=UPI003461A47C
MMNFKMMITKIAILLVILASFTQCATSQNVDKKAPIVIKDPYFQKWVAGLEGAGSGFTLFIPVEEDANIVLNYAYFRGKKVDLKLNNESIYVGRYTNPNTNRSLIMSDDPKEEFKNKAPIIEEKIPFQLTVNECIIAFTKNNKEGFFKTEDVSEKKVKAMPMRRRQ